MAQSTYGTYLLMWDSTAAEYKKLVDIIDFGDIGSTPNMIDVSDLSYNWQQQIMGNKQLGDGLTFTIHLDLVNKSAEFQKLVELEREKTICEFAVLPLNKPLDSAKDTASPNKLTLATGYDYKVFTFYGTISVSVNGGGVDEELRGTLTIALQHPEVEGGIVDLIDYKVPTAHLTAATRMR